MQTNPNEQLGKLRELAEKAAAELHTCSLVHRKSCETSDSCKRDRAYIADMIEQEATTPLLDLLEAERQQIEIEIAERDKWAKCAEFAEARASRAEQALTEAVPRIMCTECEGKGAYECDGVEHNCKVCDGDPIITFEYVKELTRQFDAMTKDRYECKKAWEAARQYASRLAAGFCDTHRPTPSKLYDGCWGCSRDEEMQKRNAAESALAAERERVTKLEAERNDWQERCEAAENAIMQDNELAEEEQP